MYIFWHKVIMRKQLSDFANENANKKISNFHAIVADCKVMNMFF